jgi:hypothetical protein
MEIQAIEQEKEAERLALPFVSGVSFIDCLRANGIETEIEVDEQKIEAHRIYGAWTSFLIATGEVTGEVVGTKSRQKPVVKRPSVLTTEADQLIKKMVTWITTSYSKRYRPLSTGKEAQWLSTIIRFVVMSRIMENKYHQWITTGQGFVDPSVGSRVAEIYRLRYEMPQVARIIYKTLQHYEGLAEQERKQLGEAIVTGIFDRLRVDRLGPPLHPDARLTQAKEAI